MTNNTLIHIKYNFTGNKIDAIAAQFPKQTIIEMITDRYSIIKANAEIYNLVIKDNIRYCIWIPVFKAFDAIFMQSIQHSNIYRLQKWGNTTALLPEFVEHLFYEYCEWLNYISKKTNNTKILKKKRKDIIDFLLVYNNKLYLLSKVDLYLKHNYYVINPFINFWYNCNLLRISLNLPLNTIFLPDINIESIQALYNITKI